MTDAEEKEQTRVILFEGKENGLYPFSFVKALRKAKPSLSILVIDNSRLQDLYYAVPKQENIGNIYDAPVLAKRQYTKDVFSKFDYVVVYLGENVDEEYESFANMIFVISDYGLASKRFLSEFACASKASVQFIFTDKVSNKVTEQMMLKDMAHYDRHTIADFAVVDMAEEDQAAYINWLRDGDNNAAKMSKDYQDTIAILVKYATGSAAVIADDAEEEQE